MLALMRIVAAFCCLIMWSPAGHAAAVTLIPAIGPPTASLKVNGTGFGAGKLIDIYFDTVDMCLTVSNGAGAFYCTIKVPKEAQPQQHWVTAAERVSGTAAQKPFTVRTDMAQFHGRNARHNGVNPYENTLNASNVGDLDVLWRQPIGPYGTYGSAVVSGGKVYTGGIDGKLYAFNAKSGAAVAGFPVTVASAITYSTPAVGGGRVFIGAEDGQLHAFDANTGAAVAGFPKPLGACTAVRSTPALALGNVYVSCPDGNVYAFNATTGAVVPGFPVTIMGGSSGSPTIHNGRLIIGSSDFKIYIFDALTGAASTPRTTGGAISSTAAASASMAFVGSSDNKLYGFSPDYASTLPGFPVTANGAIRSSAAVANGKVIFGTYLGTVYAVRSNDGEVAWSVNPAPGQGVFGSPMVANGVVYVSGEYKLHALALSSGQVLWSAAARLGQFNSPVVADGTVYFASYGDSANGFLTAYTVHGDPVSASLPGGELGVRPAISSLKPDYSLKVTRN